MMKAHYKLIYMGMLVAYSFACSTNDETEPEPMEPEHETSVMDIFPEEVEIPASQIERFSYNSDYDPLFGIGRTDGFVIRFEYAGKKFIASAYTPSYDSATSVNTMSFIDNPVILDDSEPAVLDSLMSEHGLWGVIVREFNPFTVTIERLTETKNKLPGKLKKITFHIEPGIEFAVVKKGCCGDRKFYASDALQYPQYYHRTLNELMKSFTKAPRHSATYEFR